MYQRLSVSCSVDAPEAVGAMPSPSPGSFDGFLSACSSGWFDGRDVYLARPFFFLLFDNAENNETSTRPIMKAH